MSERGVASSSSYVKPAAGANGFDGQISLLDNTKPVEDQPTDGQDADDASFIRSPLSQRLTHGSLREGLARRKYKKYQEERYYPDKGKRPALESRAATQASAISTSSKDPDIGSKLRHQDSRLERGRKKIKGILRAKQQTEEIDEGDEAIDVLYENQRGMFFFGNALFSSQSLLNFDPSSWVNAQGNPSNVDITNAQVPDPSWVWAWNNWYVDMSQDVDEQGWQYSFSFQKRFPWHGTHPWLYSFVRRRLWVRKRVKHHKHLADSRAKSKHKMAEAHHLNPDYFTIHPARDRSPDSSYAPSTAAAGSITARGALNETEELSGDIDTIQLLLQKVKKATVDREKINAVLDFMDHGGEEVYYLADEIPHIMSLFLFQYTRRQLLASMMKRIESASEHRKEHRRRDEPEYKNESLGIDNLLKAVKQADRQVQGLEYWSDIREVVRSGEALNAADEREGWGHGWQGIDRSGAAIPSLQDGGSNATLDDATALETPQEESSKK